MHVGVVIPWFAVEMPVGRQLGMVASSTHARPAAGAMDLHLFKSHGRVQSKER
jgi:hypothetical protein